ncbi:MAG: CRTAC1 family protein [Sandaracinaceae bacterium]
MGPSSLSPLAFLSLLSMCVALGACSGDRCAGVTCGDGASCSVEDGLCHCGGVDGPTCGEGEACFEGDVCGPALPAAVCGPGTAWAPGDRAFREATEAWGLVDLGVEGVKLTVTDLDGDGWSDLEVRRGRLGVEDFESADGRRTWLLRNTGSGRFEDVTERSGFLARRNAEEGGGRPVETVSWADVDNDGDLDAFSGLTTSDWDAVGRETTELLLNDGAGAFTLGPEDSPVRRADVIDAPAGGVFVDVDHDGAIDLFTPQHNYPSGNRQVYQQDLLYLGDAAGGFRDATDALGLTTLDWLDFDEMNAGRAHTRAWSGAACDLNDDGYAELLVASYGRSPNHLWQARLEGGQVTYENRAVESGYAYDEDGTWEDNQFARCFCQVCPSGEGCLGVPSPAVGCPAPLDPARPCETFPSWVHARDREPWRMGGNSGATLCGDLDNDGDLDLVTNEIRHWWAGAGADGSEVLVNEGGADPVFRRPGDDALGLAIDHGDRVTWDEGHMTGALLDFDNDGRLDLYQGASDYPGNRGLLFRNDGDLRFTEVPPADGIDHHRSHGVAVADLDRDGDLDMVVGHNRFRCDDSAPLDCYPTMQVRLFENVAGDGGNFLQLRLEGADGTNRAAIGARVTVRTDELTQVQEVDGGHGLYGAQRDPVLHFGLGTACEAEVEVRWPDASLSRTTVTLPAGHRFHLRQGGAPERAP